MQGSALVVVITVAVLAATALTSCDLRTPTVSATALQEDISERLADAGQKPESVRCTADLKGEVGQSTRCEVVLSSTNALEPIVKVTKVEGATVTYEVTPALSQSQLQKQVGDLVKGRDVAGLKSVSCASGIDGVAGNKTRCVVDDGHRTVDAVVTVTNVDGLLMDFRLDGM